MKQLIIFDLDGTLAESKSPIDSDIAQLLNILLTNFKVGIISGGSWQQFEKQVLPRLSQGESLKNLLLLPTCGTKFYQYKANWELCYSEDFSLSEKTSIIHAINETLVAIGFKTEKVWGSIIEDRGSQITFSALGQQAPLQEKIKWDKDGSKRRKIKAHLETLIPAFAVCLGGTTSIDVTQGGINKAYGIRKLQEIVNVPIEDMIFVGDSLFEGGNDFPAKSTGIACIEVENVNETKLAIKTIIACLS